MEERTLIRDYKRFFINLTIFIALILTITLVIFTIEKNNLKSEIKMEAKSDILAYSLNFEDKFSSVTTDVGLIKDLIMIHDTLEIDGLNTVFKDDTSKTLIENEFYVWLSLKNVYDQVRILDNTGQEIVRVNYNNSDPEIVDDINLQNKANRYYFTNSIILDEDQYYVSPLDLNVENGQIELVDGEPKPMLRFATPIFNESGDKLGVIIVNYLADNLFSFLEIGDNLSKYSHIEVINEDGYYLYCIDEDLEFGFMYEDKQNEVYTKYHTYDIFSVEQGESSQEEFEKKLYTSFTFSEEYLAEVISINTDQATDVFLETGNYIIFSEIKTTTLQAYKSLQNQFIIIGIVLVFMSVIIARLLDELSHQRKMALKRAEYNSNHDLLTGLPNRANVYKIIDYKASRKHDFAVMFIDFDGFKNVNDTFGHNTGDEVLIQGGQRIKNSVRLDDLVARIGGDEFLVVVNGVKDKEILKKIAKKLINNFKENIVVGKNECTIGLSIGIMISNNEDGVEEIINKADNAMYEIKKSGKNNFAFFTEEK